MTIPGGMGRAKANYTKLGEYMCCCALSKMKPIFDNVMEYHKTRLVPKSLVKLYYMKPDEYYEVKIPYREIDPVQSHYCRIGNEAMKISSTPFCYPYINPQTRKTCYREFPRLAEVIDLPEEHMVSFRFPRDVIFLMLRLDFGVHNISLEAIQKMKSLHTVRLYLYLACWVSMGNCRVTWNKLIQLLCPNTKIAASNSIRMKYIDRAKGEMDELFREHYLRFSFNYKKCMEINPTTGKQKIKGLEFLLKFEESKEEVAENKFVDGVLRKKLFNELQRIFDLTGEQTARLLATVHYQDKEAIVHAIQNGERRMAENRSQHKVFMAYAYLRKAFSDILGHWI